MTAGRLTNPSARVEHERLPNLGRTPDGRIVVAFLSREEEEGDWHLRLAPVELDPESGDPYLAPARPHDLQSGLAVCTPAFSPDGTSVYAVLRAQAGTPTLSRFSVIDALARVGSTEKAE